MATTYLQLVNNVLKRLRETEVSSVGDTPYSSMIGVFVNDAKREIEDAHNWNALMQTVVIPTASGTSSYTVTGSGQRFKTEFVFNDTEDIEMRQVPVKWIERQFYLADTTQQAAPIYYVFDGMSGDDNLMKVWPIPDKEYSLRLYLCIPQTDLVNNADTVKVPDHLVAQLAYAKAVAERGEDGGQAFNESYQMYRLALADAIAIEKNRYEDEVIWNGC